MDGKSFFDKLTGSVKLNEEMPVASKPSGPDGYSHEHNPAHSAASHNDDTLASVAVAKPPVADQPQNFIADQEPPKKSNVQQGAWPETEAEGQLTVDIFDTGDYIVVQSAVAGVDPENLEVSFADDMVTIRGRRERMTEAQEENYYYRELYWGTFSRSIVLPEEVDVEKSDATLKNGILTVHLPKKIKSRQQKIKVKVA